MRRSRVENSKKLKEPPLKHHQVNLEVDLENISYIVFDIETTGGNPEKNGITEICALRYRDGKVVDSFNTLVNPKIPVPPIVRRMTGITNAMLKDAPLIEEVMPKFVEFIKNDILVSHNTIGDLKFLRYFSHQTTESAISNLYLCTHILSEKLLADAPRKSLKGLKQHLNIDSTSKLHRAEADAEVTLTLFTILKEKMRAFGVKTIADAIRFQGDYESLCRIGWNITRKQLHEVPPRPGVFYLYDKNEDLLFLTSTRNLKKEVNRISQLKNLPRNLIPKISAACSMKWNETKNIIDATVKEAEDFLGNPQAVKPYIWHRRYSSFAMIKKGKEGYSFEIGPLDLSAAIAFGPFINEFEVNRFSKDFAENFGEKLSRNVMKISKEEYRAIECLVHRWNYRLFPGLGNYLKMTTSQFFYRQEGNLVESLEQHLVRFYVSPLSHLTGVLVDHNHQEKIAYLLRNGLVLKSVVLKDVAHPLNRSSLSKFFDEIKSSRNTAVRQGSDYMIGALSWWLKSNFRNSGVQFFPLKERTEGRYRSNADSRSEPTPS
ncbi:MAG: exonuclease domain-containing protein [Oligoflexales bacterium]